MKTITLPFLAVLLCAGALADESPPERTAPAAGMEHQATLPKDFPGDVFFHAKMQVKTVFDAGQGYQLHGRIDDSKESVRQDINDGMQALGWSQQAGTAMTRLQNATSFTKDKRFASVSLIEHQSGDVLVRIDVSR